jgi:hypothetical protein
MSVTTELPVLGTNDNRIADEHKRQRLVTAFIATGLFFMLLPGTFLGVWNLIGISSERNVSGLPQAWLQAHGQAQILGWIGSFILGIGFYSLTKILTGRPFPMRLAWFVWVIWTVGISLRWLAGMEGRYWKVLLPLSAAIQLAAYMLFLVTLRRNGPKSSGRPEIWMRMVSMGTSVFLLTLVVNCGILFHQALVAASPALPHVLDERFVVLEIWGILVPTVWGFNARWLPVFLGTEKPGERRLWAAYGLSIAGIVATFVGFLPLASAAFLISALFSIDALHVWERPTHPAKVLNIHPSFPFFIRLAYGWLVVSCLMAMVAVPWDRSGGIWGGSRHALTVGFVAIMVFAIGQRVLPAFCGMRVLWSKSTMLWSLLLLSGGCALRVFSEPLAYEGIWSPAWKILPWSAGLEFTAVGLFALNLIVTMCRPPTHLQGGIR